MNQKKNCSHISKWCSILGLFWNNECSILVHLIVCITNLIMTLKHYWILSLKKVKILFDDLKCYVYFCSFVSLIPHFLIGIGLYFFNSTKLLIKLSNDELCSGIHSTNVITRFDFVISFHFYCVKRWKGQGI